MKYKLFSLCRRNEQLKVVSGVVWLSLIHEDLLSCDPKATATHLVDQVFVSAMFVKDHIMAKTDDFERATCEWLLDCQRKSDGPAVNFLIYNTTLPLRHAAMENRKCLIYYSRV